MAAVSPGGSGTRTGWRIVVDQARCVGSGFCAGSAPDHFEVDDVSRPVADMVAPEDAVIEAAEFCPVEAISVVDAQDGTRIAPKR